MSYVKAADVLPKELIDSIQQYVEGACIYVPRKECNRKSWGENTKSKEAIASRNKEIFKKYREGTPVSRLAELYYLSPKSVQKIIARLKKSIGS